MMMPTNTTSVCMNERASWIMKPTPLSAPSNSATTRHIQAALKAKRIPSNMFGKAAGIMSFVICSRRLNSKIRATSYSFLSTFRRPKKVCKYKGKKATKAISSTLDSSPNPNHIMNNGVILLDDDQVGLI